MMKNHLSANWTRSVWCVVLGSVSPSSLSGPHFGVNEINFFEILIYLNQRIMLDYICSSYDPGMRVFNY